MVNVIKIYYVNIREDKKVTKKLLEDNSKREKENGERIEK